MAVVVEGPLNTSKLLFSARKELGLSSSGYIWSVSVKLKVSKHISGFSARFDYFVWQRCGAESEVKNKNIFFFSLSKNRIKILESSRPYRLIEIPNFLFHRKDNFVIFIRRIVQVMALRPPNDGTAQFSSLLQSYIQSHLNSAVRPGWGAIFWWVGYNDIIVQSQASPILILEVKYHHDDRAVSCNEASQQNPLLSCLCF